LRRWPTFKRRCGPGEQAIHGPTPVSTRARSNPRSSACAEDGRTGLADPPAASWVRGAGHHAQLDHGAGRGWRHEPDWAAPAPSAQRLSWSGVCLLPLRLRSSANRSAQRPADDRRSVDSPAQALVAGPRSARCGAGCSHRQCYLMPRPCPQQRMRQSWLPKQSSACRSEGHATREDGRKRKNAKEGSNEARRDRSARTSASHLCLRRQNRCSLLLRQPAPKKVERW